MSGADALGSAGVAILLGAFLANLFGWLGARSRAYSGLNFAGASLACAASWLIGFAPFVLLEGVWALVAAATLVRPGLLGRAHLG